MSKIVLEFLEHSFLFEEKNQDNNYKNFTEKEILYELEQYRNHIIKNLNLLRENIVIYSNFIRIYQSNLSLSMKKITQMAFYLDQVIVKDKLFEFATPKKNFHDEFAQLINPENDNSLNTIKLSLIIKEIKDSKDMMKFNYLILFPISYFNETGIDIPIRFPENYYNDILAPNIKDFYYQNADIRSLAHLGQGKFKINEKLIPSRFIDITFKNEPNMRINTYTLFQQEILSYNEQTREIIFQQTIPDTLPSSELFKNWVTQSLNTTSISHYNETLLDVELSAKLKAYLCPSEFTFNLLNQEYLINNNINHQTNIIDLMLSFDLSFYENINLETLMKIKRDDGEEFALFRKHLESKLSELKQVDDIAQIKSKIQDIKHEFEEVEIANIDKKIKDMRKGILNNSIVLGAELIASTITNGWSLAAFFYSLASGYQSYTEYKLQISENPAYFLWKLKK